MHHITDLEKFMVKNETAVEPLKQETETVRREHLEILLNFVRPKFQQWCEPAQQRLSQETPTVTFDELWFLMRPGSMAYTERDGHWIGCTIEESSREDLSKEGTSRDEDSTEENPGDQTELGDCPFRWSIRFLLLHAYSVSPRLEPVTSVVKIYKFDGEKLVTSLPIFPREFHDRSDAGGRRALFEERGDRIVKIVWAGSHYARHRGYCLNDNEFYVSVIRNRGGKMLKLSIV